MLAKAQVSPSIEYSSGTGSRPGRRGDQATRLAIPQVTRQRTLRLWAESGVERPQLLADMLAEARTKRSATADVDQPDRHAQDRKAQTLRSAGSIAQKLI
jgi:hypothetical protein